MKALALLLALASLPLAFRGPEPGRQDVTFSDHIAPVIWAKCLPCHRGGGMGPFSLTSYDEVRKRYQLFREVTMKKQMPPTDATTDFGHLVTEQQLTDAEIVLIQQWIQQGMKEGAPMAPPKLPNPTWRMGQPDFVTPVLGGHVVSAEGSDYRKTTAVTVLEPTSLAAFDVLPTNPQTVRFVRVGIRPAGSPESPFGPYGVKPAQLIGTWAPGHHRWRLPAGGGYPIPAGAELVVEVLYHPIGKAEKGEVQLGLYWAKDSKVGPKTKSLGNTTFILPNDVVTTLIDAWTVDQDIDIVAVYPEARQLAQQIKLTAFIPSLGARNVMMVYSYDPTWLGSYVFEKPVRLPKGTRLHLEIQYDNAKHALRDTLEVRFGPPETGELFWTHVQYVPADRS